MEESMAVRAAAPVAVQSGTEDRALRTTRAILKILFGPPARWAFAVRLWDGSRAGLPGAAPFTLVVRRPGAVRRILWPPTELALSEAYLRDDLDIEGNLEAALATLQPIAARLATPAVLARLLPRLRALPAGDPVPAIPLARQADPLLHGRRHSPARDAAAVRFHYDAGNAFYALWLDPQMVYTCGYFPTGAEDLATAQTAKLDYLCRKLRLQPGEHLLDIGCGWGGLLIHAAQHYGVYAHGITLSEEQAVLARQRIADAGLAGRCGVELRDYRDLPSTTLYDKVVSVEMFEAVGRAHLPEFFRIAYRLTRPGGLFLNQGIVRRDPGPQPGPAARLGARVRQEGGFYQRYVFPDGEMVRNGDVIRLAEAAGFETRDVENLREHYPLTLRHWVRNLEAQHAEVARLAGETAYRVWRLYMSSAAHEFVAGRLGLFQVLWLRPQEDGGGWPAAQAGLSRA